jgi:prepilin-type N-terminal cleavage/methylation domain-containing protein/prepilin-type processing-associated H-X9-DG protein
MTRSSCFSRAFTLIELIVVLAIIAILMSMVYPMYLNMSERAKATKEMSNLRQIGLATQTFLNDTDGVFFSPATPWSTQLEQNKKYLSVWRVLQSPFDKRSPGEGGNAATPISYGVNANIYPGGVAGPAMAASRITNPAGFILFAPAQASGAAGATVSFQGTGLSAAPGVTVAAIGGNAVQSSPGGNVSSGTHNSRRLINVLFADLHCETMSWAAFANTTAANQDEPNQWTPYLPYP